MCVGRQGWIFKKIHFMETVNREEGTLLFKYSADNY
jgi:hypothetical protein